MFMKFVWMTSCQALVSQNTSALIQFKKHIRKLTGENPLQQMCWSLDRRSDLFSSVYHL